MATTLIRTQVSPCYAFPASNLEPSAPHMSIFDQAGVGMGMGMAGKCVVDPRRTSTDHGIDPRFSICRRCLGMHCSVKKVVKCFRVLVLSYL